MVIPWLSLGFSHGRHGLLLGLMLRKLPPQLLQHLLRNIDAQIILRPQIPQQLQQSPGTTAQVEDFTTRNQVPGPSLTKGAL